MAPVGLFPEQLIMNKMHTSVDAFMDLMEPGIAEKVTEDFRSSKNAAATVDFGQARPRALSAKPEVLREAVEARERRAREKKARQAPRARQEGNMPAGKGRTMREVPTDDKVIPRIKPGANLKLNPGFQKLIKEGAEKARKQGAGKARQGGDP